MNPEKAIEVLKLYMKPSEAIEPVDFDSAILLGIEALKREEYRRKRYLSLPIELLPGETED